MIYSNQEAVKTAARVVFNALFDIFTEMKLAGDIVGSPKQQAYIEDNLIDRYNIIRRCIFINEDSSHEYLLSKVKDLSADEEISVTYETTDKGVLFLLNDKDGYDYHAVFEIWSLGASIEGVQLKLPSGRA